MKITIGVPIFNQKTEHFRKCLESIKNQTYNQQIFECIILDDGSDNKEEVEEITKEFGFKYIYQKNSGVGSARQAIVDNSSKETEYICFLSSDDIWMPNFLETMVEITKEQPEKVLYSTFYRISEKGEIIRTENNLSYNNHKDFCIACLEHANESHMFVNFSTTFFPKKVFEKVQFDKELRFGEDLDFLLRTMKHFEYHLVNKILLKYRVGDNLTLRIRSKMRENNDKIIRDVRKYWESKKI